MAINAVYHRCIPSRSKRLHCSAPYFCTATSPLPGMGASMSCAWRAGVSVGILEVGTGGGYWRRRLASESAEAALATAEPKKRAPPVDDRVSGRLHDILDQHLPRSAIKTRGRP